MYTLKPMNDVSQPISIPDVMYRLKPINDPGEIREKEVGSSPCVESLEKRQEVILRGLSGLKDRLSAHKVGLGLEPIPSGQRCTNSFAKQDVVIFAHPSHPPYGILLAYHVLKSRGLRIVTSCHAHSSISGHLPEAVTDFLPSHPDEYTRSNSDLIMTIIWKKLDDRDPITVIPPVLEHSSIKGEISILRYLCRLYPSIWSYASTEDPRVEHFLDAMHSDLIWPTEESLRKQKEEIIFKSLESVFLSASSSSTLFSGCSEPGILDLAAWSIATQNHGKLAVPSSAMKKWITSCNKFCAFYGSRQHRLSSHRHRRVSHGRKLNNNSKGGGSHRNNSHRKKVKSTPQALDVESDFAPGSLLSRQWPTIPDVIQGDPEELFISDIEAVVCEKLDGSNLSLSSNGAVGSRRVVLLQDTNRDELRDFVFAGVSLESLGPLISILQSSLSCYFKELLKFDSLIVTVFGELIQEGTATSKEDRFKYKERGFSTGSWHAFGISLASFDPLETEGALTKLKTAGFGAKDFPSKDATGKPRQNDVYIVLNMNSHLETFFRSFKFPTLKTKTLPFKDVFETYEATLLQPGSCEGLVITLPSIGAAFKWKQLSGGFLIQNGTFFNEKSSDPRYSEILSILKRVSGAKESNKVDLLRVAYESARTKYPDTKEEKYSKLITDEILKDLGEEEINEHEVRQFILRQR